MHSPIEGSDGDDDDESASYVAPTRQSHCRKGSRVLDKHLSCSSSVVLDVDLEGNVQEENLVWVDDRSKETWDKYEEYLAEKYTDECGEPPKFDQEVWHQASGGMKKGKVYGLSSFGDSSVHSRKNPEIEKLNEVITELVKGHEEEKERLNGIIADLRAEKEIDKLEKDTMKKWMANIEAMLASTVRK